MDRSDDLVPRQAEGLVTDALRSRRPGAVLAAAERLHELLAQAAAADLPAGPGLTAQRAEELIAEIRAGRDVQAKG